MFIVLGAVLAITVAIILNEIRIKAAKQAYQTVILIPHLISMVVVSYLAFAFLSDGNGFLNKTVLPMFGIDPISWYNAPQYWPFILVLINIWKGIGYSCILYYATICGIDHSLYEAAVVDGANRWQQVWNITLPCLKSTIIILTLMNLGNIFRSDFGLFYQVPMNSGPLQNVTSTIDTYVYRGLMQTNNIGMSSAAGGGSEAALPVESASGPAIAPQLVTALLLLSLAALVLAGVAALVRWLWRSRSRIRLPEEDDDDGLVRQRLGRRGLLSRLGQRLRVRAFLLRYAGTPRAALLELEHWGARRRCRRQSQETPREYLERLAGGPLRDALDAPMQARYSILVDDVERSLYSTLPPRLSREQVRELLSTVHRSARTPPARAK